MDRWGALSAGEMTLLDRIFWESLKLREAGS